MTDDAAALLAAYDAQLRGDAEMAGALSWDRSGPLWRALFTSGGFVSYESLEGVADVDALIAETVAYFADNPAMEEFEWKTRGHDWPPDLGDRLEAHGLVPEELETVMVGEATALAVDVELPDGRDRTSRGPAARARRDRVEGGADAARRCSAAARPPRRCSSGSTGCGALEQFWVAEADGQVVSAGRLDFVEGTEFAGLWGGVDAARVARPRHLPRPDRRPCAVGAGRGGALSAERLQPDVAPDPGALGPGRGHDQHAVRLAPLRPTWRPRARAAR